MKRSGVGGEEEMVEGRKRMEEDKEKRDGGVEKRKGGRRISVTYRQKYDINRETK